MHEVLLPGFSGQVTRIGLLKISGLRWTSAQICEMCGLHLGPDSKFHIVFYTVFSPMQTTIRPQEQLNRLKGGNQRTLKAIEGQSNKQI